MSRRPDHIPARKSFSASVKRAVQERSGGICEKLGCNNPAAEIDHGLPVALGGPSTLPNAFHLCKSCHLKKTRLDVKMIAKADRQGGRSGQYKRRKKNGSQIQSRGFQQHPKLKRTIGGKVVERT